MSISSDELQLLIAGYVLGDLSPEEAAAFEQLLAEDPAIATEAAQLQTALETVYAPPEATPSAHLRSRILTQAESTSSERRPRSISQSPLPWRGGLEAVAAGLIVVLGINNYRLQQALISQSEAPPGTALTYVLKATQGQSPAVAVVIVNPHKLEATVSAQHLPPLPSGKVYALWTVVRTDAPFTTDTKQAILTEVFPGQQHGTFTKKIVVPKAYRSKEFVTNVAMTIEDAHAPHKHTGTPIMVAQKIH